MAQKMDLNLLLIAGGAVLVVYFINRTVRGFAADPEVVASRTERVFFRQEQSTNRTTIRQDARTARQDARLDFWRDLFGIED